MTINQEAQKSLKVFNKMNKLFDRLHVPPEESIPALLIAATHAAINSGLSKEVYLEILNESIAYYDLFSKS